MRSVLTVLHVPRSMTGGFDMQSAARTCAAVFPAAAASWAYFKTVICGGSAAGAAGVAIGAEVVQPDSAKESTSRTAKATAPRERMFEIMKPCLSDSV